MKFKILIITALLLSLVLSAHAQVIIINDNMTAGRLCTVSATVVDSLTNEAVPFASMYVVPSRDTTITNFTLTDQEGKAKLEDVPYGSYVLRIEMLGYQPFVKERYFRDRKVDLGTVKLKVDENFLSAAVVSDVGNPIVVKQDTVEFNASSFRVGSNAMLKDLLARMPGMEVGEDGSVKFNGEAIDKLTVGGRTFFFNDQSTALNNLPAAVVDKIRVIDRDSEQTRASGVDDGKKEKVLDVALKKEYEQGWFGNAGLKGGTTIGSKESEELRDNRGMLWSGNALASAYTTKDQLTFVANAQNVNDNNGVVFVSIDSDGNRWSSGDSGLSTAMQLGVNANTSRIKDTETTLGLNWKHGDTDSGSKSYRTTYQEGGDLRSSSQQTGKRADDSLNANLEFEKEKGDVWFHIRPGYRHGWNSSARESSTVTMREGLEVNSSEGRSSSSEISDNMEMDADISFRNLWGKKKRVLTIQAGGYYRKSSGGSSEFSSLRTASGESVKDLDYESDGGGHRAYGILRHTEPLGDKWTLTSLTAINYTYSASVKNAFEAGAANDYYSSESRSKYLNPHFTLISQYKFAKSGTVSLGARLSAVNQETYSRSFGIAKTVGQGEWDWYVTPTLRFNHISGNNRYSFNISGNQQQPGASRMLPVLDISNPSRLSVGNVYLKPYSSTNFYAQWNRNNKERFTNLMLYLYGALNLNSIRQAQWYDADGIMYSVPVNSRRPAFNSSLYSSYTTPLDSRKNWSMTVNAGFGASSSTSYQAKSSMPGMDKDNFDYGSFMEGFWGDESGERFYSGESGFAESSTLTLTHNAGVTVKYRRERFSAYASASTSGYLARYSLNQSANMSTLSTRLNLNANYTTKHEFEFDSEIAYIFYNGYAEGYGLPELRWNAEISKNIGAFNLSIKVNDILNQTRNLSHTVTANYEEDSYRLVLGRFVLFGLKWNFGKMNAEHSRRAENAAWNMAF